MVRTQIQLEERQYEDLKVLADERSASMAQLVRESVDDYLEKARRRERRERFLAALGSAHDPEGATDVAENHDDYLAEIHAERVLGR